MNPRGTGRLVTRELASMTHKVQQWWWRRCLSAYLNCPGPATYSCAHQDHQTHSQRHVEHVLVEPFQMFGPTPGQELKAPVLRHANAMDAGVGRVKPAPNPQRHPHNPLKNHRQETTVGHHKHAPTLVTLRQRLQARHRAIGGLKKGLPTLDWRGRIGRIVSLDRFRMALPGFLHRQPLKHAQVPLPQPRLQHQLAGLLAQHQLRRLARSTQITAIHPIKGRASGQITARCQRLQLPKRRQRRIQLPLPTPLEVPLGLSMAQQHKRGLLHITPLVSNPTQQPHHNPHTRRPSPKAPQTTPTPPQRLSGGVAMVYSDAPTRPAVLLGSV